MDEIEVLRNKIKAIIAKARKQLPSPDKVISMEFIVCVEFEIGHYYVKFEKSGHPLKPEWKYISFE